MAVDRDTFLEVMTAFPTGVGVVTTVDEAGEPWGLTSNAISSVSADPPMLLVCVARTSRTLPALLARRGFLVNFMADGSSAVSALFASKATAAEKFEAIEWISTQSGHPLLASAATAFADCETVEEVEAGSHVILIGSVVDAGIVDPDRRPLAYYRREFTDWPRAV